MLIDVADKMTAREKHQVYPASSLNEGSADYMLNLRRLISERETARRRLDYLNNLAETIPMSTQGDINDDNWRYAVIRKDQIGCQDYTVMYGTGRTRPEAIANALSFSNISVDDMQNMDVRSRECLTRTNPHLISYSIWGEGDSE